MCFDSHGSHWSGNLWRKGLSFPLEKILPQFPSLQEPISYKGHGFHSLLSMVLQFRRSTQAGSQTYVCAYTCISGVYIVLHTHTNCVRRAYCVEWMDTNHLEPEYLMSKYVLGVLPVWIKKKKDKCSGTQYNLFYCLCGFFIECHFLIPLNVTILNSLYQMVIPAPAPEIQESTTSEWLLPAHLVNP